MAISFPVGDADSAQDIRTIFLWLVDDVLCGLGDRQVYNLILVSCLITYCMKEITR
jgi:hypothetical protein